MSRLVKAMRNMVVDDDRRAPSSSQRPRGSKRGTDSRTRNRPNGRLQTHFYDPHAPEITSSSSDELDLTELDRCLADTLRRVEDAEAALAKERKRIEQIETRRREFEAKKEYRRTQQNEDAGLSPREKNRKAFEKEVARVQRNAMHKIEELERRFAHSDKLFELNMARGDMPDADMPDADGRREQKAAGREMGYMSGNQDSGVRAGYRSGERSKQAEQPAS